MRPDPDRIKLLLFDLDGTLLRSDKTVSPASVRALERLRGRLTVAVCTSRSWENTRGVVPGLPLDALVTSGGAEVRVGDELLYSAAFTPEETAAIISAALAVCGPDVRMDVDTRECNHRNYIPAPHEDYGSWGEARQTDFSGFWEEALMACVEVPDPDTAARLRSALPWCDVAKFVDGDWYKLTRAGVTKESGVLALCRALGISPGEAAAFGDDVSDIGMLRLAGLGVAMGNAVPEVKGIADAVIGSCDTDSIAGFLRDYFDLI